MDMADWEMKRKRNYPTELFDSLDVDCTQEC